MNKLSEGAPTRGAPSWVRFNLLDAMVAMSESGIYDDAQRGRWFLGMMAGSAGRPCPDNMTQEFKDGHAHGVHLRVEAVGYSDTKRAAAKASIAGRGKDEHGRFKSRQDSSKTPAVLDSAGPVLGSKTSNPPAITEQYITEQDSTTTTTDRQTGSSVPVDFLDGIESPPMKPDPTRSWMDWKLTHGKRLGFNGDDATDAVWAAIYHKLGWDEMTLGYNHLIAQIKNPKHKVWPNQFIECMEETP